MVILDVGANVEAESEQLVEFAIMGEAFQRAVSGNARPSVALLNVGAEDQKGHEEIRSAARLIREAKLDMNFHGFVEGDDIAKGTVDVVVTDGFTGNIALKTGEGTARLVGQLLREALTSGPFAMLGALIATPALKKLRARMDPGSFNGALFLGLNGLVVKSHGSASGQAMRRPSASPKNGAQPLSRRDPAQSRAFPRRRRRRRNPPMRSVILGVGLHLPAHILTNAELRASIQAMNGSSSAPASASDTSPARAKNLGSCAGARAMRWRPAAGARG